MDTYIKRNGQNRNTVLGFKNSEKSQWRLREDVRRILLYEAADRAALINRVGFLHPSEAIILSLFNGKRTVDEIINSINYLFEQPQEKAEKTLETVMSRWGESLEEKTNGNSPEYNPEDFVLPVWKVDLLTKRLYKPLSLTFHVSDDCMRNCIYCNVQRRQTKEIRLLSLGRWKELTEEVKVLGIISVVMGGGDPFMRKDFIEILSYFTTRNIHPFVSTKAFLSERTAGELAFAGLKKIQISIDAPSPEVADFLAGSKNYFTQIKASIKNLAKHGIKISTNSILTSYNVFLAPSLVHLLMELGVEDIKLSAYARSLYNHRDELFIEEDVGNWLEDKIAEISDKSEGKSNVSFGYHKDNQFLSAAEREKKFKERPVCSASRWGFVVLSDGKVIPCDEIPVRDEFIIGDVTKYSILEVWQSPLNDKYVNPPQECFRETPCHECFEFEECMAKGICFRDTLKAFGSIFAAPPNCPKAPKGLRLY